MKEITASELEKKLEEGEHVNMIDVREADEIATGKVIGAVHIPLGEIPARLDELDKTKPYTLICRSGGRSGRAAEFLESEGFDITNMTGGMLSWQGPIE
ncbi:rhodanese-like domain-containing protein [Sporosarcina sp. NCCP-2716]|uniref:rhodanese-like domain-containing protein n=1 Tax=Sporosarcina sp. NCCP-2716 TaxID=2943679 RepID=UPI0020406A0B|nr:rhodanese-like domain-containing protein [Sporosarcina sp. NCCP-2716]GKV68404.1 rhodanese-like domain-containing protein [Sporosarcina sp. NCCP-2716]